MELGATRSVCLQEKKGIFEKTQKSLYRLTGIHPGQFHIQFRNLTASLIRQTQRRWECQPAKRRRRPHRYSRNWEI